MKIEILPDAEAVALRAAKVIAHQARHAARLRGRFLFAVSGGATPRRMLEHLANEEVPWPMTHVFQVDERIASAESQSRNFNYIQNTLLKLVDIPAQQIYPMPVEDTELDAAAARYAALLHQVAGTPPKLDLVHLGLGADGHTASLIPGDPVLDAQCPVAVTGPYQGYRRMTLTYPALQHARHILWVVTGAGKAHALAQLREGNRAIPAAHIPTRHALLLADVGSAQETRHLPSGPA